jgi:hypothetical protein
VSDEAPPALWELDESAGPTGGATAIATELSRGPWDPRHCHGGPVAALLARAVERVDAGGDVAWQLARVTVELTRPVPVQVPLTLTTRVERPGRRVSLVGVVLLADDVEVARARGLRIRATPFALPDVVVRPDDAMAADVAHSRLERPHFGLSDGADVSFATHACEHRFAAGRFEDPGPVDVWIRITVPVVAGEEPTGAQRACAAADFGNGVSAVLPWDRYLFINPDLTVHLARTPVGEWIGLRAVTHLGDAGAGVAESALHDEHGVIGRAVQSLFVDDR